jgi:hypothetical protein
MRADGAGAMERVKGIEPSYEAWEAAVLPLNYTRIGFDFSLRRAARFTLHASAGIFWRRWCRAAAWCRGRGRRSGRAGVAAEREETVNDETVAHPAIGGWPGQYAAGYRGQHGLVAAAGKEPKVSAFKHHVGTLLGDRQACPADAIFKCRHIGRDPVQAAHDAGLIKRARGRCRAGGARRLWRRCRCRCGRGR